MAQVNEGGEGGDPSGFLVSMQQSRLGVRTAERAPVVEVFASAWPLILAVSLMLAMSLMSSWLTSGARAYVAGESLWAKAQKNAVSSLRRYVERGEPAEHEAFTRHLRVPLGDRLAREALQQPQPDVAAAREGFLQGGNDPDDIGALIRLFRLGRWHPSIANAVRIWTEGDAGIEQLQTVAARARAMHAGTLSVGQDELLTQVDVLDRRLTRLEEAFSAEIGHAARDLGRWLDAIVWALSVALIGLGLAQARYSMRQRLRNEETARRFGERLELATLGANDGIWDWHLASRRVYWTPRVRELIGYPTDDTFERYLVRDNVHPADLARFLQAREEHLLGLAERMQVELRLCCHDGTYRWFRLRGMAMRDGRGRPVRVLGTISDIHANMIAEQALRAAWEHSQQVAGELELALDGANVALWAYEPATGAILHHKRWETLLGRKDMPSTFQGWLALTHPDDRAGRLELLRQHLDNLSDYYESEFRMRHVDETWVWVRSRGRVTARDSEGRALQYAGAVMNITAQVAAREVKRREQDFLRVMIQGVDVGVMIADFHRVIYVNAALARMLGYEREDELANMPLGKLMPVTERRVDLSNRERAAAGRVTPMRVARLRKRSGERAKLVMNLSCVDWNGEHHFISTLSALAAHEEVEAHLRAATDQFERAMLSELEAQQVWIARELHDSLGSTLAGISLLLGGATALGGEPRLRELLERSQEQVRLAAEQTRGLARGIMPVGQHRGAFLQALDQFCVDLEHLRGLTCSLQAEGDFDEIQPEVGNHIYRIAQEATTNAIRHGQATCLEVVARQSPLGYSLSITDNGAGFEVELAQEHQAGVGMRSMRARAKAIGARIEWLRTPDGGCQVELRWTTGPALDAPESAYDVLPDA